MLRREKYGHIPDQAQHGKAQAIDGGDAVVHAIYNAISTICNGMDMMQWIWHDRCNILKWNAWHVHVCCFFVLFLENTSNSWSLVLFLLFFEMQKMHGMHGAWNARQRKSLEMHEFFMRGNVRLEMHDNAWIFLMRDDVQLKMHDNACEQHSHQCKLYVLRCVYACITIQGMMSATTYANMQAPKVLHLPRI